MNGDGIPDLIVGEKNTLRVLLNRTGSPRLMPPLMTELGTTIRWTALPGRTYRVQFKAGLQDSAWTNLEGDVSADSTAASKVDISSGSGPQRFYRAVMLPWAEP